MYDGSSVRTAKFEDAEATMRENSVRSFWKWGVAVLLMTLVAVACGEPEQAGGGNGETHFLGGCSESCGGGLECICGVCTKRCDGSNACGALNVDAECMTACAEAPVVEVCDVGCSSNDECRSLGAPFRCVSGRCRSGGNAGSGGSAGSAGNGGSGAGSGTTSCGGAPSEVSGPQSPLALDPNEVAIVAALVGSCFGDDAADRYATHLWEAELGTQEFYARAALQSDCLTDARCGCDALRHCLGLAIVAADACTTACNGDVLTGCGEQFDLIEGYAYEIDCGRVGLTCDTDGICLDAEKVTCADGTPPVCSSSGAVEVCDRGVLRRGPVCADFGLACVDGACQGTGAACTGGFAEPDRIEFLGTNCSGSVLEACVDGRVTTLDCASRGPGFGCHSVGEIAFCGIAAECVPATRGSPSTTYPPTCSGSTLRFCNAGRLEQFDCPAHGFTGCDVDEGLGCVPGQEVED